MAIATIAVSQTRSKETAQHKDDRTLVATAILIQSLRRSVVECTVCDIVRSVSRKFEFGCHVFAHGKPHPPRAPPFIPLPQLTSARSIRVANIACVLFLCNACSYILVTLENAFTRQGQRKLTVVITFHRLCAACILLTSVYVI